jgi:Protein of unknown function (DUF1761)
MVEIKYWIIPIAALVPLIIGFIWYNPKVCGTAWMNAAGLTEEKMKGANMGLVFFLTYLFSCLLACSMLSLTIHQMGVQSALMNEEGFGKEGSEIMIYISDFLAKYGSNFRTFKHGALHGTIAGIFIAFPILAINALFERKGWKYIWINAGYWIISMLLMGGIVCQFA